MPHFRKANGNAEITLDPCILASPMLPPEIKTLMTNSAKYAYYAPSLLNTRVTFGSLEDCVRSAVGLTQLEAETETDRYISWPAQALSYKLGQLKFRELRDRAQQGLGAKFDIRSFHDEMLSGGVLPLDLLDSRTNSWIHGQQPGVKSAAAN